MNQQVSNPDIQPGSSLALAGAAVAAPAADLAEMEVRICPGAVLVYLVCVGM